MSSLWPLGVAIYVSGTVGEALGANLQRKSLTTEAALAEADPSYEQRGKFKQKKWVVGFFLFIFAGIFMSVSLNFASQTVLAPLQLFLFVSNAIFASLINKEIFNWLGWDGLCLLLVIIGVTMAIVSAPKHTESYSNDEMVWLMQQPGFISFCIFAGCFIVAIWLVKNWILASCKHDPRRIRHRSLRTVLNMSYGATAGAFGGVNVTLTKTVFSLLVGQFNEGGVTAILSSGVVWATSFVLVATYALQIIVTVSGLEVTSAIIVISAHSVTEEVVATSGGILYFQDYLMFEAWSWAMFIVGNMTAIVSVIGLSHLRLRDAEAKEQQAMQLAAADADYDMGICHESGCFLGLDLDQTAISHRIKATADTDKGMGIFEEVECSPNLDHNRTDINPQHRTSVTGFESLQIHDELDPTDISPRHRTSTMAVESLQIHDDGIEISKSYPLTRRSTTMW